MIRGWGQSCDLSIGLGGWPVRRRRIRPMHLRRGADFVYFGGVAHRGGRHYQHGRIECSVMGQAMEVRDSPISMLF
jgi:hypothetical protein